MDSVPFFVQAATQKVPITDATEARARLEGKQREILRKLTLAYTRRFLPAAEQVRPLQATTSEVSNESKAVNRLDSLRQSVSKSLPFERKRQRCQAFDNDVKRIKVECFETEIKIGDDGPFASVDSDVFTTESEDSDMLLSSEITGSDIQELSNESEMHHLFSREEATEDAERVSIETLIADLIAEAPSDVRAVITQVEADAPWPQQASPYPFKHHFTHYYKSPT